MAAGDESQVGVTPVPPLPPRLDDPRPVVAAGTAAWFLAALVLAVLGSTGIAFWTCVAGGVGGLVGYALMHWQRSAARRRMRGAQRGLR